MELEELLTTLSIGALTLVREQVASYEPEGDEVPRYAAATALIEQVLADKLA